jgi:hypothetical protein
VTEGGRGIERGVDGVLVDRVELEREKQQMSAGVGHAFLDVAVKLGPFRIAGVAGIDQAGVGDDAPDQFLERLIGFHRLAEPGVRLLFGLGGKLAAPVGLEGLGVGLGALEVARQFPGIHRRVEVGEIPFGQVAQSRRGLGSRGGRGRLRRSRSAHALFLTGWFGCMRSGKGFVHRLC